MATGNHAKGHELHKLFTNLSDNIKQKLNHSYVNSNFENDILSVSNSFVEWRYAQEHEALNINPQLLIDLATACHIVARQLKPSLKVFGEN